MTQREDGPQSDAPESESESGSESGSESEREREREREGAGFRVSDRRWWVDASEPAEEPTSAETKPSYVQQLERDLAAKEQQLQDTLRQFRDARDEFERAKGRIERESERERSRARLDFLRGFLPVLDDLERAADAAAAAPDVEAMRDGIELVQRRFLGTLRDHGVLRVHPKGETFDPRHHEALTIVPVADAQQDGRVIDVVESGYSVGDEILRPARVTVGKYSGN